MACFLIWVKNNKQDLQRGAVNTVITTEHFISELVALMRICSATDLIKWTK